MAGLGEALTSKREATNKVTVLDIIFRLAYATSVAHNTQLENEIPPAFITNSINFVDPVIHAQRGQIRRHLLSARAF